MDPFLVVLLIPIALWVGLVIGYGWGVSAGREDARVRRRLEELDG